MKAKLKTQLAAPLNDPDELIDCNEAGRILTLAPNTVRDGKGGTDSLTRVRVVNGQRTIVRLLKVEVMALRSAWIAKAKARQQPKERALRLIEGLR